MEMPYVCPHVSSPTPLNGEKRKGLMRRRVIVAYFMATYLHLPGWTEANYKNSQLEESVARVPPKYTQHQTIYRLVLVRTERTCYVVAVNPCGTVLYYRN
jgi:hypothetical protein